MGGLNQNYEILRLRLNEAITQIKNQNPSANIDYVNALPIIERVTPEDCEDYVEKEYRNIQCCPETLRAMARRDDLLMNHFLNLSATVSALMSQVETYCGIYSYYSCECLEELVL